LPESSISIDSASGLVFYSCTRFPPFPGYLKLIIDLLQLNPHMHISQYMKKHARGISNLLY
ncbi:hypothetical protein ACJX0J_023302, partial [Zea mays]